MKRTRVSSTSGVVSNYRYKTKEEKERIWEGVQSMADWLTHEGELNLVDVEFVGKSQHKNIRRLANRAFGTNSSMG